MDILGVLKELNIEYELQEHKAVYTVGDLQDVLWKWKELGVRISF